VNSILQRIINKKTQLDQYRPMRSVLVRNLDEWFRVELTYTSNAIEGNTLTRQETALVVEKGITVEGKTLKEHLEATNHAEALDYVKALAGRGRQDITEDDVLQIHRFILHSIDDPNAGRYRNVPVRIAGAAVVLPNYAKVPELMAEFMTWLHNDTSSRHVDIAAEAHYRLVSIHPFVDGNGRTARLLMNLLLMQTGYPAAVIRTEDRRAYINALERGQTTGDTTDYYQVIYEAVERSLDIYLDAVSGNSPQPAAVAQPKLISRQQLAELTGARTSTLAYYSDSGLLPFYQAGPKLARRYDQAEAVERIGRIQELQQQGLSLEAIKGRLDRRSGPQVEGAAA